MALLGLSDIMMHFLHASIGNFFQKEKSTTLFLRFGRKMPKGRQAQPPAHRGVLVAPRLLLGSQRTCTDPAFLVEHRVTHCLCVARELPWPPQRAAGAAVCYHRVPLDEQMGAEPALAALRETVEWGVAAHAEGGSVLVFCRRGLNRSASVVAGILSRAEGVDVTAALEAVRRAQPKMAPESVLRAALSRLNEPPPAVEGEAPSSAPLHEKPLHENPASSSFWPDDDDDDDDDGGGGGGADDGARLRPPGHLASVLLPGGPDGDDATEPPSADVR